MNSCPQWYLALYLAVSHCHPPVLSDIWPYTLQSLTVILQSSVISGPITCSLSLSSSCPQWYLALYLAVSHCHPPVLSDIWPYNLQSLTVTLLSTVISGPIPCSLSLSSSCPQWYLALYLAVSHCHPPVLSDISPYTLQSLTVILLSSVISGPIPCSLSLSSSCPQWYLAL